ncbi:MAG: methyltransferase domain-containing protein [Rickettsiaceae bacterium]|nr:MAG: methyltransferase domain-containing protein [Rickettsiaceae bacterium]
MHIRMLQIHKIDETKMMNKETIVLNFNKAALDYENIASVQKKSASYLVQCLNKIVPNFAPAVILDIGAGTGIVTKLLLPQFPVANYILNDLSPNMLEMAKNTLCNNTKIEYVIGDAENINFQSVDLAISNLCFQWFTNFEESVNKLWKNTKILAFSTLSSKTFNQWNKLYYKLGLIDHEIRDYPTNQELETYCLGLQPTNYFFHHLTYKLVFNDALSFLRYLKKLGANTPTARARKDYLKIVIQSQKQPLTISYKIFFALLIK